MTTDDTLAVALVRDGYDRLWNWFGLSRASFLVVPRVLMHEMPDEWQAQMAALLAEYREAFPFSGSPAYGTTVRLTLEGQLVEMPEWLNNYRHPDRGSIQRFAR